MPPGTSPRKWTFPARNRIIAALAEATIVVEAAEKSGSLITAEFALELGREVLAVPGSVRSWRSDGTNALIRDGATLIRDARDVLDAGSWSGDGGKAQKQGPSALAVAFVGARADVAALLKRIEAGTTRPDELITARESGSDALAELAELGSSGLVRRTPTGGYERCSVG